MLLAVGLGLSVAATSSRAETPAEKAAAVDMKTRYEHAVTLYKSGQFDKAIEEFQAVYEMRPAPILLFNLAQAHRKAGHKAQALDLYERFGRENQNLDPKKATETDLKLKSETEQYITELKAAIEADKLAEKEAADKAAAEKAAAEKAAAEKAAAEKAAAEKAAEAYRHRPLRPFNIAKWALAGAGVALVIVGAALIGVDGKPVCPAEMPQVPGQVLCPMELDTKAGGAATLVVGLGALGGSAALFYLDYKQTREAPRPAAVAFNVSF